MRQVTIALQTHKPRESPTSAGAVGGRAGGNVQFAAYTVVPCVRTSRITYPRVGRMRYAKSEGQRFLLSSF